MVEMVDNSMLGSVARCQTMALMRYVFGYTTSEGMAMANAGTVWHKSNEVWFKTFDIELTMDAFDVEYDKLLGAEQEKMEPKDPKQKQNFRDIAYQYYLAHPPEFFPFEPIPEGIEAVHKFPLIDGVEFFGLIDLPVRERKIGALYVCDHKTRHGYINQWWTNKFGLTSQFSGYIWLLQQLYQETVPGIYINALAVQKLPDATGTKCRIHKVPQKDCRLQHAKWQLFISTRSPQALIDWETDAKLLAAEFLLLKKAFTSVDMVKYAPQRGKFNEACTFCDYKKFCKADRAAHMAESLFTVKHWRPWEVV